jgi:hypothetical protein
LKDLEVGTSVPGTYDIAVDFIDMTDDRYLWVRATDARPGFEAVVGGHAVIGDEDADPRVARIVAIDDDGNLELELEVLPGAVETYLDLLARA